MRKVYTLVLLIFSIHCYSQDNTFPTTGNVGIGTTSPTRKLEIIDPTGVVFRHSQTANTAGSFRILGGAYSGNYFTGLLFNSLAGNNILGLGGGTSLAEPATNILFYTGTSGTVGVGSERMRIDNTGRIGIGISNPSAKLEVKGNFSGGTNFRATGNSAKLIVDYNSLGYNYYDADYHIFRNGTGSDTRFFINGLNGKVGIGTSSPSYKLEISSSETANTLKLLSTVNAGQARLNFQGGVGGLGQIDNAVGDFFITNSATSGNLIFRTENTGKMRITSDGNVGIGSDSPGKTLEIKGGNEVGLRIFNSNANFWDISNSEYGKLDFVRGNVPVMRLDQFGNVGIGTQLSQYRLEVSADAVDKAAIQVSYNGTQGDMSMVRYFNGYTQRWLTGMDGYDVLGRDFVIREEHSGETFRFNQNGDFQIENGGLYTAGKVKIGTEDEPEDYILVVGGKALIEKVVVRKQGNWPDFVFHKNYELPELSDIEVFINSNNHLPEIPSAKEIEANGQDLGEMNRLLLKKVEELTLYTIDQSKQIELLKVKANEVDQLKKDINFIKSKLQLK